MTTTAPQPQPTSSQGKASISVLEVGGEAVGSKTGSFTKLLHIPKDSNLIKQVQ
jgi:hypothetical protein